MIYFSFDRWRPISYIIKSNSSLLQAPCGLLVRYEYVCLLPTKLTGDKGSAYAFQYISGNKICYHNAWITWNYMNYIVFLFQMIFLFQQAKVYAILVSKTSLIGNYARFAALYQMKLITQLKKYALWLESTFTGTASSDNFILGDRGWVGEEKLFSHLQQILTAT